MLQRAVWLCVRCSPTTARLGRRVGLKSPLDARGGRSCVGLSLRAPTPTRFCARAGARKKRSFRCGQITSCTYSHSRVRVAGGELNPQCAARTAAAQTVARPPPSWGQAMVVCLVQERAVASWSVGCLAWQVASVRRGWYQHHRTSRRQTKAKLRLSVTPHGPRRLRKGSSRAVPARFVLQSEVGTSTHDGSSSKAFSTTKVRRR